MNPVQDRSRFITESPTDDFAGAFIDRAPRCCARARPADTHTLRNDWGLRSTVGIARIGIESKQRLGKHRWVVEGTMASMHSYRKLSPRHDRTAETIPALATLPITITCARRLPKPDY